MMPLMSTSFLLHALCSRYRFSLCDCITELNKRNERHQHPPCVTNRNESWQVEKFCQHLFLHGFAVLGVALSPAIESSNLAKCVAPFLKLDPLQGKERRQNLTLGNIFCLGNDNNNITRKKLWLIDIPIRCSWSTFWMRGVFLGSSSEWEDTKGWCCSGSTWNWSHPSSTLSLVVKLRKEEPWSLVETCSKMLQQQLIMSDVMCSDYVCQQS